MFQLVDKDYPEINESYDYLLKLPIYTLSKEEINLANIPNLKTNTKIMMKTQQMKTIIQYSNPTMMRLIVLNFGTTVCTVMETT